MLRVLWNSKSGMQASSEKLDSISNNIANANTSGYKKQDVSFQNLMSESFDKQGYPISDGKEPYTGTGVKTTEVVTDKTQGQLTQTDNPTDLAIDGEGYFRVIKSDGTAAYKRAGSFGINSNGNLADSGGNILSINYANSFNEKNVKLTQNNFIIDAKGGISLNKDGTSTKVGSIPIFNAIGDNAMVPSGESSYAPSSNAKIYNATDYSIRQGFTENSNVDMASEMTELLITQRAFQLNSKGINIADQMWGIVNNLAK